MARGEEFRNFANDLKDKCSFIKGVRGRGLLNAIIVDNSEEPDKATKLCYKMRDLGVLAKPTHDNIIRFAPPLIITKEQLEEGMNVIKDAFTSCN